MSDRNPYPFFEASALRLARWAVDEIHDAVVTAMMAVHRWLTGSTA